MLHVREIDTRQGRAKFGEARDMKEQLLRLAHFGLQIDEVWMKHYRIQTTTFVIHGGLSRPTLAVRRLDDDGVLCISHCCSH